MTLCSWSGGRKIFVFCERIWISIILIPALCPRVSIYRTSLWIKLHFVDQVTHDTKQYALANALAIVGEVPFDSHDALNDARSAALLCTHLGLIRGLNEYKEAVENRNGIVESYEFEEPYADIGDALSDDYVVSFECPHCGEIVWGENWIRKTGTNLLSLSQCSDGQEYLISLKFRPIAENKVVVKRLVHALTDELRTDYQQCMEQAAAWSKYVIPAYSF